jgi:hypothetical protein
MQLLFSICVGFLCLVAQPRAAYKVLRASGIRVSLDEIAEPFSLMTIQGEDKGRYGLGPVSVLSEGKVEFHNVFYGND